MDQRTEKKEQPNIVITCAEEARDVRKWLAATKVRRKWLNTPGPHNDPHGRRDGWPTEAYREKQYAQIVDMMWALHLWEIGKKSRNKKRAGTIPKDHAG